MGWAKIGSFPFSLHTELFSVRPLVIFFLTGAAVGMPRIDIFCRRPPAGMAGFSSSPGYVHRHRYFPDNRFFHSRAQVRHPVTRRRSILEMAIFPGVKHLHGVGNYFL